MGRWMQLLRLHSSCSWGIKNAGNDGVVRMINGYIDFCFWRLYASKMAPGRYDALVTRVTHANFGRTTDGESIWTF